MATFEASAHKFVYLEQQINHLTAKRFPTFYRFQKKYNRIGGLGFPQPVDVGGMNPSSSFAAALSNASEPEFEQFVYQPFDSYIVNKFNRKDILKARKNIEAFANRLKYIMNRSIQRVLEHTSIHMFGNGTGSVGQVAVAGITGATLQLADPSQFVNFYRGQIIQLAAVETGGAPRAGTATLAGVSNSGVLTASVDWTTAIPGATDADFLYYEGDYDNVFPGLSGHVPDVAPTAGDNFLGVDRSNTPEVLAGERLDISSTGENTNLEVGLIEIIERVYTNNGYVDTLLCNPKTWNNAVNLLGSKKEFTISYPEKPSALNAGAGGVYVHGLGSNAVELVPDRHCRSNRIYAIDKSQWCFEFMLESDNGPFPEVIKYYDGPASIAEATLDAFQIRIGGFLTLRNIMPNSAGVLLIDPFGA